MSDIYKEKEWDLRNALDSNYDIPTLFENYASEVNNFIDRIIKSDIKQLHDKDQEIERLNKEIETHIKYNKYLQSGLAKANSIIKEVREYMGNYSFIDDIRIMDYKEYQELLEILDKVEEKEND